MGQSCTSIVVREWIRMENATRNVYPCAEKFKGREIDCEDKNLLKELFLCLRTARKYVSVLPSEWELRELGCHEIYNIELISDWTEVLSKAYTPGRKNVAENAAKTLKYILESPRHCRDQVINKLVNEYNKRKKPEADITPIKKEIKDIVEHFEKIKERVSSPLILERTGNNELRVIDGNHRAIVGAVMCLEGHKSLTLRAYVGVKPINYAQILGILDNSSPS